MLFESLIIIDNHHCFLQPMYLDDVKKWLFVFFSVAQWFSASSFRRRLLCCTNWTGQ